MRKILYLGTDPTQFERTGHFEGHLIHYPIIQIVPKSLDDPRLKSAYDDLDEYTHLILTSKNAVQIFADHLQALQKKISSQVIIAIGEVTAAHLALRGMAPHCTASQERQEGIIDLLNTMDLEGAYLFLPRSSLARPLLTHYLVEREIRHQACDLYDTVPHKAEGAPDLKEIDEIVFTSPSTVHAFLEIYQNLPQDKKLTAIGPITEEAIAKILRKATMPEF